LNHYIELKEITSIWYRRSVPINNYSYNLDKLDDDLSYTIQKHKFDELKYTRDAFFNLNSEKKWLNSPSTSSIDKTQCLLQAKKFGLIIPKTIITNNKADLINFYKKVNFAIIKPIYNMTILEDEGDRYLQYTTVIENSDIENFNETFFPCLVQEKIFKNIELRVFYLNEKIYSMAKLLYKTATSITLIEFNRYA